jgi:hypothetical protein
VYYPFSKWYKSNKQIERHVIKYKSLKKSQHISSQKTKKIAASQVLIAAPSTLPEFFFKTVHELNYEVEVYPKFIYYEKIGDKGERPH